MEERAIIAFILKGNPIESPSEIKLVSVLVIFKKFFKSMIKVQIEEEIIENG